MATWAKCNNKQGEALWVNLDNVTSMTWRDTPEQGTDVVFINGGHEVVRQKPEDLAGPSASR
ncbi:MAG: hypothetical protein ACLPKB_24930 [Xanthobacteraceae bacterium]